MTVLIIILILLLVLLLIPVGVDFSFFEGQMLLRAKIGLWYIQLLPTDPDKPEKERKPKKEKKEKKKKAEPPAKAAEADRAGKKKKPKAKLKFTFDDIIEILKIAFRALGRFGRSISIDYLELHLTAAAPDPYDAVMQYGYVNAAFGTLMPLARKVLKIRREEIGTDMSFDMQKTEITARVAATLQIWEILHIVFCAAFSALAWFMRIKRASKKAAKAAAGKGK